MDPQAGYRPYLLIPKRQNNDPHTLFILSFSGGGTRAAAFSYGVLEELRRTEIVVDGKRRRLVDEVDLITVDGGVADNIGVRGVLEAFEELAASAKFRDEVGFGVVRRIVLIVANARSAPRSDWDRNETPPGVVVQLLQASGVPIDRYSFETVELMKDRAEITKWRRELAVARKRLAGETEAQAEASVPKFDLHVLDVSFEALSDPKERDYFMNLPTSFVLRPEEVDRLRGVVGQLLRQAPEFEALVRELGGAPAK